MNFTNSIRVIGTALLFTFMLGCRENSNTVSIAVKHTGQATILIQDVAVFNSQNLKITPHQDVIVREQEIQSVTPTGEAIPDDVILVSGHGATLVPGLMDMHGHISLTTGPSWDFALPQPEANMLAYVYAGVTTVFDPGDSSSEAGERRARVAAGDLIGPRIFTAGKILTAPEGHPRSLIEHLAPWWIRWYLKPRVATGIENQDQVQQAIDKATEQGVDAIKIVVDSIPLEAPQLNSELIAAIVKAAAQKNSRTVAHIGTTNDAIRAADNGVSLWVHGVYKERIPDGKIEQLVAYGIPMVPTNEVFDRYGRSGTGPIEATKLEREIVAAEVLDSFYPIPDDFDLGVLTSWVQLMQETILVRRDNVRRLHQAGMTILAGSDTQSGVFPGAGLHRELGNLLAAGLSPAQVIAAATFEPAKYLENTPNPSSGIIAVGKRADLLLVEGDPTQDISALQNIREVILNGKLLERTPVKN